MDAASRTNRVEKIFSVYVLENKRNSTLYIGVTSDLLGRVWQHKNKAVPGLTAKYGVDKLVYYEAHDSAATAVQRERQLKKWNRKWKLDLIESVNPRWRDLYSELTL